MATLRPQAQKLLHIAKNVFAKKTFSKTLGTEIAELLHADHNDGVVFTMKVPERICLLGGKEEPGPYLPVSSAIAIFDDLSTYSFLVKDKKYRSGVSVVLSAELLRNVSPGTEIRIVSKVSKIGRSIGFSDMFMYNEKEELVARGYHTKYLPMGTAWDIIASPAIMDTTLHVYDNVYVRFEDTGIGKYLAKLMLGGRNRDMKLPEFDGVGSAFTSFDLKRIDKKKSTNNLHNNSFISNLEVIEKEDYSFNVMPFMCNIRGFLHGGCVAMTIEQSVMLSKVANESNRRLRRLDIQYLNGMKVNCNVYNHLKHESCLCFDRNI